jgi:hypothetical protein
MIIWRVLRFLFWEFLAPVTVFGTAIVLLFALVAGFGLPAFEAVQPLVWLFEQPHLLAIACMALALARVVYRVLTGYYESGYPLRRV